MSNYNSTLQSNNTDLQAILNTINELPNAGSSDDSTGGGAGGSGGGSVSVETCTVRVMGAGGCNVVYLTSNDDGNIYTETSLSSVMHNNLKVVCGSHVSIVGNTKDATAGGINSNGAELCLQKDWGAIFIITAATGENANIAIYAS